VLRAFGSSGVSVNGLPVAAEHALREGDVVEIAYSALRFTTKAPTNEMFVIPRDTPTFIDQLEGPTKATLRAMNRSAILRGTRRYWHVIAIVVLIVGMLVFLLASYPRG
jgi:hypothetical protein